MINCKVFRALP